jgi:iron complex outermembrane receptor protein
MQVGVTVAQKLPYESVLRATAYGGTRNIEQFLALPGTPITSSGGVTDLDRTFGGIDARITTPLTTAAGRLQFTIGVDYETEREARKGFVNNNGTAGDLRRNEDNTLINSDVYAQLEWWPAAGALRGWRRALQRCPVRIRRSLRRAGKSGR